MKRVAVSAIVLALSGCANHYVPEVAEDPYGFFSGLWHGFVCPYAIAANLMSWLGNLVGLEFWRSIEIIGRPNTGLWYYVGFIGGLLPYLGGGAA